MLQQKSEQVLRVEGYKVEGSSIGTDLDSVSINFLYKNNPIQYSEIYFC